MGPGTADAEGVGMWLGGPMGPDAAAATAAAAAQAVAAEAETGSRNEASSEELPGEVKPASVSGDAAPLPTLSAAAAAEAQQALVACSPWASTAGLPMPPWDATVDSAAPQREEIGFLTGGAVDQGGEARIGECACELGGGW